MKNIVSIIALKITLAFTVVRMKLCVVMKELTMNYKQAYDNHTPSSENIYYNNIINFLPLLWQLKVHI